jgi:ABC-type Zn uptake system ZnuABC Zn-binding protein ZnuA
VKNERGEDRGTRERPDMTSVLWRKVVVGCGAPILCCAMLVLCAGLVAAGCGSAGDVSGHAEGATVVLADTSFMADIAQNVAGDRLAVSSLLPLGADPHSFEPTPQDAKRVADSTAVIINIAGFEPLLDDLIAGAGRADLLVVEAAAGVPGVWEDPHAWLDPIMVITYVENVRDGLSAIDPEGAEMYRLNAQAYAQRLRELDSWIAAQVARIPAERRLLVTNHESFGYFAERYGFRVVGTVFPSAAGEGSPSAQQLVALVNDIKAARAPAIFLETGSNADLARQMAEETGVKLVTDLYTHSLGEGAATYLDMMRWNVGLIVEALR